jgi:hypothetical protein
MAPVFSSAMRSLMAMDLMQLALRVTALLQSTLIVINLMLLTLIKTWLVMKRTLK